ncbi:MAG TPA: class I SAM-dependent methyltransferase [Candidatus Sulfotelmatobacter sp.]
MISHSDDYVEYCRETARRARDPHDLALRGRDNKDVTRRIHQEIADATGLCAADDLVDVGCGEGTMLRLAQEAGAHSALGLLATDEEVAVVRRCGLNVRQGLTDQLPLPDQCASIVVCNSVLLVVPRHKVPASLSGYFGSPGQEREYLSARFLSLNLEIRRLSSTAAAKCFPIFIANTV